jgi:DtxR family Mn-dependent transcriptional regulator
MQNALFSESIEMYLKTVAEFDVSAPVAISHVAQRLGITQVSANEMVKRLSEQELVSHVPYKGITLTLRGQRVAYNVIRRQRLWECFLHQQLKMEWARIYELACDLEHATAPEVTDALAALLGQPQTCPHGSPIPAADGSFAPLAGVPLSQLAPGGRGRILAVLARHGSTDVLRYLQTRNILPGQDVMVLDIAPMHGPLTIRIAEKEVSLGLQMAELVVIEPEEH